MKPHLPDHETPAAYIKALRKRTKELRIAQGFTQAQMAKFLGLDLEVYKKYENRSPLPHRFIHDFCVLVGCDETYFLTGTQGPHPAGRLPRRAAHNRSCGSA